MQAIGAGKAGFQQKMIRIDIMNGKCPGGCRGIFRIRESGIVGFDPGSHGGIKGLYLGICDAGTGSTAGIHRDNIDRTVFPAGIGIGLIQSLIGGDICQIVDTQIQEQDPGRGGG